MPKPLSAGREVDSWCTKCRLVLTHRIVAMVGSKPARVECETCGSQHNYRATAPGAKAERAGGRVATRTGRAPTVTRVEQARREREQSWAKAVNGRAVSDFVRYNVRTLFNVGDLIKHTKFGDGVVTRVIDPHKVEVLFQDEARTLAQGLT